MSLSAIRTCFCIVVFSICFAAPLHHVKDVEFDEDVITIHFNKAVDKGMYNFFQLKSDELKRDIYDFDAIMPHKTMMSKTLNNGLEVRIAQNTPQRVRLVLAHSDAIETKIVLDGLVVRVEVIQPTSKTSNKVSKTPTQQTPVTPKPSPTIHNKRIVVLDAGHGGKDCGAMGVTKVCEKTIVLNLAKELQKELLKRGYHVHMTRSKDVFIPLKKRTEFANSKGADVFISIHANAVQEARQKELNGIETYFLSPARSERAKSVAAAENKEDIEELGVFSRETVLGILNAQRLYASHRLALDIQFGVLSTLKRRYDITDGGVREGPFWVLAGALMPSILLEIGYITHPKEGKLLAQPVYQKLLAKGIADGIDGYFAKNY